MTSNPWVARFSRNLTDAEMDLIIEIAPKPISFEGSDAVADSERLNQALRRFFLPDAQIRQHLRTLVSVTRAHAENHFSSDSVYLNGLYSLSPWGYATASAICLTGLAGVGKSDLINALRRLLAGGSQICVAGHTGLPLVALWHLSMQDGPRLPDLLRPYVDPVPTLAAHGPWSPIAPPRRCGHMRTLLDQAKKITWRNGVCLLLVDELQFMSHGAESYASILAFLLRVLGIGPRVLFCANFSLVHKLKRRNQEHQDRFLARPIIFHPLARDSTDWIAYLAAAKSVAPDALAFDPVVDASELHQYTYGIKRSFVELVTIAFRLARARDKKRLVGMKEVLAGYRSLDYTTYRKNVEDLQRQAIEGRMIREDLWCPLVALDSTDSEYGRTVSPADQAIAAFEQRVNDKLLDESLTPAEAAAVRSLNPQPKRGSGSASVIPIRGRKTTKADLLAGASVLESL